MLSIFVSHSYTCCYLLHTPIAGDGICDGGLYVELDECSHDGFDCEDGTCDLEYINDGVCDIQNYSQDCHWDGDDCDICANLAGVSDDMDLSLFLGNDVCDQAFDIYECSYDGGDCDR